MLFYMRQKLIEITKYAYPEKADKYCDFYLQVEFKEKKTSWSNYDFSKRQISVNTLSRSPADVLLSMLVELSKHIDIKIRRETHLDRNYYAVLRKLIQSALETNLILIDDLTKSDNEKLKKALQENFGTFSKWKAEVKMSPGDIYIHVFDNYLIRNLLKAEKYFYDDEQNSWSKKIKVEDIDEERAFTSMYEDDAQFVIISDNRFYIRPVYLLRVYSYSFEDNKLLHAFSYTFNSEAKCWEKLIYAADIKIELQQIEDIPKQKILISKKK